MRSPFISIATWLPRQVMTIAHELGQQAAVVKVSVGQKDRLDAVWRNWEVLPVPALELPFLKQATVHQEPGAVELQEIAGAGDVAGRAQEAQFGHGGPPQGYRRAMVRGKGMASRMWWMPVSQVTVRSSPRPKPECGTEPKRRSSRYQV